MGNPGGGTLDQSAVSIEKRGGMELSPVRGEAGAFDKSDAAAGPGTTNAWAQGSPARKWIALALLVTLAGLAVKTIDPGKVRSVVLLLLGIFGLRIVLTGPASR
jgi:hypothetical protein